MKRRLYEHLESLFARCPALTGFAVRSDAEQLYVSDIGIAPRLSAEQYGEIYQDIAQTLGEMLDEYSEAVSWLQNRTFARSLH